MLILILISLAHWINSLHVDMLLHLNILSWFWANQSLLLLLNITCLSEKKQISILYFFAFQPDLRSNPRSAANKASMLSITSPMRLTPIKISQGLLRDKKNYTFNCAYLFFIILWRALAYFFTPKMLCSAVHMLTLVLFWSPFC
jgi:hypothetical protein